MASATDQRLATIDALRRWAATAVDDRRIHRPVDRAFLRERQRVNAANEHGRNKFTTSHEISYWFVVGGRPADGFHRTTVEGRL